MDYEAIHLALSNQGFSWKVAAEALGRNPSSLMNVAARRSCSRPTARGIAQLLGKRVSEVFPDIPRYAEPSREELHQAMVAKAQNKLKQAKLNYA